jgi:hypothetical protein
VLKVAQAGVVDIEEAFAQTGAATGREAMARRCDVE